MFDCLQGFISPICLLLPLCLTYLQLAFGYEETFHKSHQYVINK